MAEGRIDAIRNLYEGHSDRSHRFRYALLAFDFLILAFVVATSFTPRGPVLLVLDLVFGVAILTDLTARFVIARRKARFLLHPATLADVAATLSFLALALGEGAGFLRVLRTLRLLHSYSLLSRLRRDIGFFRRHEEVFLATANMLVFLFVMTGTIYATQHQTNPAIANYADALYFTVTTLTTTGFGDITLEGTGGRMLAVAVMIVGVGLFLRLAQVLFRPTKVRHECPRCGLMVHDIDAVHCKHCGVTLHIETEGVY